jgi:hypothetical protein
LGGLALGTSVALTRMGRKPRRPPLRYEQIPRRCQRVILWTELFAIEEGGKTLSAHDEYLLEPTHFKVWSVLELPTSGSALRGEGATVFHVSVIRYVITGGAEQSKKREVWKDKFYGIIVSSGPGGPPNRLARGASLTISKCYVGGAANGVESGELHRSMGRILNYRFEYAPRPDSPDPLTELRPE